MVLLTTWFCHITSSYTVQWVLVSAYARWLPAATYFDCGAFNYCCLFTFSRAWHYHAKLFLFVFWHHLNKIRSFSTLQYLAKRWGNELERKKLKKNNNDENWDGVQMKNENLMKVVKIGLCGIHALCWKFSKKNENHYSVVQKLNENLARKKRRTENYVFVALPRRITLKCV